MNKCVFVASFLAGALCLPAWATNTAKIRFEQTVCDFGKTSAVQTVTGAFKYKNVGDAVLKIETPKPTCGCTIASLKPDTLPPGESGELVFTLNLGRSRATMEKYIMVKSNDPETPEVKLTIKADYTPLYDVSPMALAPNVPLGSRATNLFTTITRSDGKPLQIARLVSSKPWIKARLDSAAKTNASTARILVDVEPDGPPRQFNEYVHVFAAGQTNGPASVLYVYGKVTGDLVANPEALYWSISGEGQAATDRPESQAMRRVTIRSAKGQGFELKNLQCSLSNLEVKLESKEPGKGYELVANLKELPAQTVNGKVSVETSVAAQPKIELPVVINVYKR